MLRVELPALIGRLNAISREALESSAALCISRQGAEITASHLLYQLLDTPLSDVRCLLSAAGLERQPIMDRINQVLAEGPTSSEPYPGFSPLLVELLQDAWLLGSAEYAHSELRSGPILLTMLLHGDRYLPRSVAECFTDIRPEHWRGRLPEMMRESAEEPRSEDNGSRSEAAQQADEEALVRYATDLTAEVRGGRIDPVMCRDAEIDQMIDILCRRRKNNPIVVGEAGVGKSAVVEGLAHRIVAGEVPSRLAGVRLLALDLGALQAGASVRGEFEKRLKAVIEAVKQAADPITLFIDEAHTLIGAGNPEGGSDAANLLKPALARGELRTIAATTWREYKKHIEKDPALSRRFQRIGLEEPDPDSATTILRGLRVAYEGTHDVLISDEALQAASHLSSRYLTGRQLPDKAIDVLDTACARVSLNLTSVPYALSHLQTGIRQQRMELELLEREARLGDAVDEPRLSALRERIAADEAQAADLEERWQTQQALVHQLIELRQQLLGEDNKVPATDEDDTAPSLQDQARALKAELDQLQGDEALVHPEVNAAQIAAVIGDWTGIPVSRMTTSELERVTRLPEHLGGQIRGQDLAITRIHEHLLTARADLRRPGRPMGAFLLVGPSGVGKTETVVQLADWLYGGKQFLTTINMSEYQEKHTVSRLIGSPPGYVGFGEGGRLTEAIRQKPYSVVLLDEVEKAHPDVLNLFYQAFDKGELADGEGRMIDCRNVVFFMTSNLGYEQIVEHAHNPEAMQEALHPVLADFFRPALLARMEVVPYLPLNDETLNAIIHDKLDGLRELVEKRYQAELEVGDGLVEHLRQQAWRSENGARMLESIIEGQLLPPVSRTVLERLAREEPIERVSLGVDEHGFTSEVA